MTEIRVLIADDHTVLREGLAMLIGAQEDMTVVAQASSGPQAVELAKQTAPDVAVMDISMPEGSGIEAVLQLREVRPELRVVVLSMHDDPVHVRAVLASGASGFIPKHAAGDRLLSAIREVFAGQSSISVPLEKASVAELFDGSADGPAPLSVLSKREREVLRLVAEGFSNSQIGERLGVSKKSVDTYRVRVSQKLGLRNRAALIRYALDVGILRPGQRGRE